jgi:hypothetical protein
MNHFFFGKAIDESNVGDCTLVLDMNWYVNITINQLMVNNVNEILLQML